MSCKIYGFDIEGRPITFLSEGAGTSGKVIFGVKDEVWGGVPEKFCKCANNMRENSPSEYQNISCL